MTLLYLGQNIGVQESWSVDLYDDFSPSESELTPVHSPVVSPTKLPSTK